MGFETNRARGAFAHPIEAARGSPHLSPPGPGFACNDKAFMAEPSTSEGEQCHFDVFRANSVPVTTTLFSGGDWRWQLSDHDGQVLVEAEGYNSEAECREAVAILRSHAGFATLA